MFYWQLAGVGDILCDSGEELPPPTTGLPVLCGHIPAIARKLEGPSMKQQASSMGTEERETFCWKEDAMRQDLIKQQQQQQQQQRPSVCFVWLAWHRNEAGPCGKVVSVISVPDTAVSPPLPAPQLSPLLARGEAVVQKQKPSLQYTQGTWLSSPALSCVPRLCLLPCWGALR